MTTERIQLTLSLDEALCKRLRLTAGRMGVPVSDYCANAIEAALRNDAASLRTIEERINALDSIDALRQEIFGDRVVKSDSVLEIREARATRDEQIDIAVRGEYLDNL